MNMTDGSDSNVDSRRISKEFKTTSQTDLTETVTIHGGKICDDYCMTYPKTGKCLIFNNKTFDPDLKAAERHGTDADAFRLYCKFKALGFEVEIFHDLIHDSIFGTLKKAGKEDHSNSSAFVCCVLSHGDDGFLYAKDAKYPIEKVFAPFQGDVCPSLVGKPKMFFIQACQGNKLDPGVNATCKESLDSISKFKIPTCADFLVMCSTVPGFYSFINPRDGSCFIQTLCACIEQHAKAKDLLSVLTIVNRTLAFNYETYVPSKPIMDRKKQMPLITSTLTRNVKFP